MSLASLLRLRSVIPSVIAFWFPKQELICDMGTKCLTHTLQMNVVWRISRGWVGGVTFSCDDGACSWRSSESRGLPNKNCFSSIFKSWLVASLELLFNIVAACRDYCSGLESSAPLKYGSSEVQVMVYCKFWNTCFKDFWQEMINILY